MPHDVPIDESLEPLLEAAKVVQAILNECPLFFCGLEAILKELNRNPIDLTIACNAFQVAGNH